LRGQRVLGAIEREQEGHLRLEAGGGVRIEAGGFLIRLERFEQPILTLAEQAERELFQRFTAILFFFGRLDRREWLRWFVDGRALSVGRRGRRQERGDDHSDASVRWT
jgi:hypothetical protein